jgi:cbb3-type cytochrome oxidase subunit 3
MPNIGLAEIYFIAGMMVLILIISFVAIYFFFKTYKKEMREKELRLKQKEELKKQKSETQN